MSSSIRRARERNSQYCFQRTSYFINQKETALGHLSGWLSPVEHASLDLRVMSASSTMGVEIT